MSKLNNDEMLQPPKAPLGVAYLGAAYLGVA